MKKILIPTVLILLVGYITFAAVTFCNRPEGEVCKGIRLEIRDSLKTGYMTTKDITAMLAKSNLDPTGRQLDEVSLQTIEKVLENSPLISSCECYKTINGQIVVALIDDSATVKRFYKKDNKIILHPENDNMQDMIFDNVVILGVVKGLMRKI